MQVKSNFLYRKKSKTFCFIFFSFFFVFAVNAINPIKSTTDVSINNNNKELLTDVSMTTPFWKQAINNKNFETPRKKSNNPELKEKAKGFMVAKQQALGFQENKGQMADDAGSPVPFVLFKAEAPNLNIWVTNTGLTYQFFKLEENEEEEQREKNEGKKQQHEQMKEEKLEGEWHRVDMVLKGANIKKENIITENDITQGAINYYLGHCPNGIFNVKTYTKITIKDVYPGIDWVLYTSIYHGKPGLKHDFTIHPKADPDQIKLIYEGSGDFEVNNNQIHFKNELGELKEGKLLCYQGTETNSVISNYNVQKTNTPSFLGAGNVGLKDFNQSPKQKRTDRFSYEIGIEISKYNNNEVLVIDPQLVWGTFYGGNGADGPLSIDTDGSGNVFVTGYCSPTTNFPTQNAGTFFQGVFGGGWDAFVLKFSNNGTRLWSTYYGGNDVEQGISIATDVNGNVFVTGHTSSSNFPTQNAGTFFQGALGGGAFTKDAFILKFNNLGTRLWATYYGGNGDDQGNSIATDASGNLFVAGQTSSPNFPTQNAGTFFQGGLGGGSNDAFILKFDNLGTRLWATYYGGSSDDNGYSITLDINGNLFVLGNTQSTNFPSQNAGTFFQGAYAGGFSDSFILKFDNSGNRLWGTYYGGGGEDYGNSITTDANGDVFVLGTTNSTNFLTQNAGTFFQGAPGGSYDAFILKFTNSGNLVWGTYYGASGNDFSYSITTDACGNVYVSSETYTPSFTHLKNSCGSGYNDNSFNGVKDIVLSLFSNSGNLLWCTYVAGDGTDFRPSLAIDANNNLFMAGEWKQLISSASYPLANPGGGAYYNAIFNGGVDDGFIIKFIPDLPVYNLSQLNPTACACNGLATISLTCGEAPFSYIWSNGYSVHNTTLTSNTNSNLCPGVYQVTITSACNHTYTTTFTLTGTIASLTANFVAINASCSSPTGSITINSVTNGLPNYTLAEGTTTLASNITTPFFLNNISAGSHTYLLTDANGCSTSFTANILPSSSSPNLSLTLPATITCSTPSVILTGSSLTSGAIYNWQPQNVNTPTALATNAGIYTLTVTDPINGCATSTVVTVYSDPAFAANVTVLNQINCFGNNNGALQLGLSGGIGSFSITNLNNGNGIGPISSFPINLNNLSANTYSILVIDNTTGCKQTLLATINQPPQLNLSLLGNSSICEGQSTTISSNSTGGTSPYNYVWLPTGGNSSNLTVSPNGNVTYSLTITDNNGCQSSASIAIVVNPKPNATLVNNKLVGCVPVCASFSLSVPQQLGYTYSWQFSNTQNTNITSSQLYNPNLCFSNEGVYDASIFITTPQNCTSTIVYNNIIQVYEKPIADFDFSPNPGNALEPIIHFTNTSTNANYYYWNFGEVNNNNGSTLTHPNFIYTNAGTYLVTLIASNAKGCADTAYKQLKIEEDFAVYIPNTFSPNEDNLNDAWGPQGIGISDKDYELIVFNRWGEKLFTSKSFENRWNGTYKGELVKNDVYVYKLKCKSLISNKPKEFNGHVLVNK